MRVPPPLSSSRSPSCVPRQSSARLQHFCLPVSSSVPALISHSSSLPCLPPGHHIQSMYPPQSKPQVVFSSDVSNMDDWARRTRIPLTTAGALGSTYARSHRWLQQIKNCLIREHGWVEVPTDDHRLLISLESTSIWRSSIGLPAGPKMKLQLPIHASSFFSPERRVQWEIVFHSDTFESMRKICPPISDILNLIQCLLTGLVTLVFEEHLPDGHYQTTRGIPPVSWISENEAALVEIFGQVHFKALRKACSDTNVAFKLDVFPK